MRKTWARLILIVAVVCAAGFGWIYHQRASTSSEWLTALANQTSISTNNSALANTSSTDGRSLQATNGITSTGRTQSGLQNDTGTSRTLNAVQNQSNATTAHQTNTVGSNSAHTAGTTTDTKTKSSSTERSTMGNSVSRTSGNTTASNTASSTGTSKTSNSQANSTGASSTGTNSTGTNSTGTGTTTQTTGSFTIIVSENHGQTVLDKKVVAIQPRENLMQYMQQNFTIETTYGGAFITAIDGIKSQWTGVPADQRKPVDWFLYINSQQAPVGAADIVPRKGDVDDWDYHSWNPSTGQG